MLGADPGAATEVAAAEGTATAIASATPSPDATDLAGTVGDKGASVFDLAAADAFPVKPKRVKYRRSWPQRICLLLGVAIAAAGLKAATEISDVQQQLGEIPRVNVSPGLLAEVGDITAEARNILIIGSDDVVGLDRNDPLLQYGSRGGRNTDTMMILRIDPVAGSAAVLSIPRDLSFNAARKVNSYAALGDPEPLIRVLTQQFDIEIHDFMIVNFAGFRKVIDAIDGVPVYFDAPTRDLGSFFDAPLAAPSSPVSNRSTTCVVARCKI